MAKAQRLWLGRLFEGYERRQLNYVVLRANPELLEFGYEIDLLVHPRSFGALLDEISQLCVQAANLRVLFWRERPYLGATVILGVRDPNGSWDTCWLDIRSGIYKHGDLLMDGSQLSRPATVWDEQLGVRRLCDEMECALLLLRNAIDGRPTSQRHDWILTHRASPMTPVAVQRLGFDPEALQTGRIVHNARRSTVRVLRYRSRAVLGRIRARRTGLNIVLYGPDGVGKSSQRERLSAFFRRAGVPSSALETYHAFVRTTQLAEHSASHATAVKSRTYKSVQWPPAQAALLLASFGRRITLYVTQFRPRLKRGVIMIHDRYFLDVFLKFQKQHGRRYPRLEAVLSKITPSNDVLFVLRCDPDVVSQRTSELTREGVVAAYRLLDDCLAISRSAYVDVNANASADEVEAELSDYVTAAQTKRFVER